MQGENNPQPIASGKESFSANQKVCSKHIQRRCRRRHHRSLALC